MKENKNIELWISCNEKKITKDEFVRTTGYDFDFFGHKYRKECLYVLREKLYQEKLKRREARKDKNKRCQYSKEGIKWLQVNQRVGTIKGKTKKGAIKVHWDGLSEKTIGIYHRSFIEFIN